MFKVGDKVLAVRSQGSVKEGCLYTVTGFFRCGCGCGDYILNVDKHGNDIFDLWVFKRLIPSNEERIKRRTECLKQETKYVV